jgi:hypothetical protein
VSNTAKAGLNMKTTRIRQKIKLYLMESGPQGTHRILDYINNEMTHGTTSQQLGNVLAKDKDLRKVGLMKRASMLGGQYDVCVWDVTNDYLLRTKTEHGTT